MVNTCALYGATTFANNWLGINVLIILTSLLIVAAVYAISSIFPIITKEKLAAAARSELTQQFLSAIILAVLLGAAVTACGISASVSRSLTGQSLSPFQYATYYVGNLSVNTGLNLLTNIYSTSVSYSIESEILKSIGAIFNTQLSKVGKIVAASLGGGLGAGLNAFVSVGVALGVHLSTLFDTLSGIYLTILAPLVTIAVGLLFIQFIMIPVLQYTAFTVVLPVALAMRSLSFMGNSLRTAANAALAVAIAAYIIYPLTIAFNGYAISWIFSNSNPSFQYLKSTYIVPNIPVNQYFSNVAPGTFTGFFGTMFNALAPLVTSSFASTGILISPYSVVAQTQMIVNQIAQFLFASVIMIVIDLAITVGFAIGLMKALNAGVEGAGSFWGGI